MTKNLFLICLKFSKLNNRGIITKINSIELIFQSIRRGNQILRQKLKYSHYRGLSFFIIIYILICGIKFLAHLEMKKNNFLNTNLKFISLIWNLTEGN